MTVEVFPAAEHETAGLFRPHAVVTLRAIVHREALRFLGQRGRLIAALVRPLVWLFVFAAGFAPRSGYR